MLFFSARGDGSSKDWENKNSPTKPLLCQPLHLRDAGLRQERGSHGEVLCHRAALLAGKPNERHLYRYTKSMPSYIPEPLNTRQAICLLLWEVRVERSLARLNNPAVAI